jgi:CubicO group peptidase (beta-lactamase class C family)
MCVAAGAQGLPKVKSPEEVGFSSVRLKRLSDRLNEGVKAGELPGAVVLIARNGRIVMHEAFGFRDKEAKAEMKTDTIFRIASMTKPIVATAAMMLMEEGKLSLADPVSKYIPAFAETKVAVKKKNDDGTVEMALEPQFRPMTVQDLLRHTSGLTYEHQGDGPVHKIYQESRVRSRKITNAEHAALVASFPLVCHPGDEFNYSRSTDILGRIIEIVSGKSLSAFLTERILAPLQMTETAFSTSEANAGRLAEPFAADPWTGDKVALFNMLEQPIMESGGGGLVSTTMDYARFALMLRNGGTLDGNRIIGRKTLELMASDHLGPHVVTNGTLLSPGHGFGLGFAVRRDAGIAPFPGSVGQYFWSGIAGTFFWIDPKEDLFTVFMSQGPGQRDFTRTLVRDLVYAAVE